MSMREIDGVIFDMDGVLLSTDDLHYRAWKELADREGIHFDRQINERLRGVSRMDSLRIILERASRHYNQAEQLALAEHKNARYRELLRELTPAAVAPQVRELLAELRRRGLRLAVASSSRNLELILGQVELRAAFDAVVDGNEITRSKPDPEVFLLAAGRLGLPPARCLVVEDAESGIEAARRAGMHVFGIGPRERLRGVPRLAPSLADVQADELLGMMKRNEE
jgi:beta-phosphoglucomutase